jgi:MFS family permease
MKKESFKNWFVRVFKRDVNFSKHSIVYIFLSLLVLALIVEAILFKYIGTFESGAIDLGVIILVIVISVSFLISGPFIDNLNNKTRAFNIILLICIIGLFFNGFNELFFSYTGLLIVVITIPQLTVLWFSVLIHETNILNRGRITAFLITSCFFLGMTGLIFVVFEFLYSYFFILIFLLLFCIVWQSRKYKYIETKERLKSNKKFLEIIFEKHFFRYSSSLTVLSFILGDLFARYGFTVEFITFSIMTFFYLIAAGCFLDNIGRKISIVIGILILSFFLISSGSFLGMDFIFGIPKPIFLALHYACSLTPLLLVIITISGDFSTERGNLKYRARINGLFMALMLFGIIVGFLFSRWINGLYLSYPELNNIIPNFPILLNSFILVILLVWMMAMKEFLISKEKNWSSVIIDLYVFSVNGVGLYYSNFEKSPKGEEKEKKREMDEDLISGALTGVVAIISEITQSKKQLRKIDKEGYHLLFSFGKYHVACLISKMDLPVLLKKLDEFSKDFEIKFRKNLKNFVGDVGPFNSTKYLKNKYFSQKYGSFK